MAKLAPIPTIEIKPEFFKRWGLIWLGTEGSVSQKTGLITAKQPNRFDKKQGMDFGKELDKYTADALAVMLGGIQVVPPVKDALLPPFPDCVELGDTTVAGGVRTQNYDCAYRPDGPRFVY